MPVAFDSLDRDASFFGLYTAFRRFPPEMIISDKIQAAGILRWVFATTYVSLEELTGL